MTRGLLIAILIVLIFPFAFGGIWFLVTGLLRTWAGMTKDLKVDTGSLIRTSSWGSGTVNGVRATGCLQVAEYERGWVVQLARLFGGGKLWLPKDEASIGELKGGKLFMPRYRTIHSGHDRVRLYGALASFIDRTP